MTPAHRRLHPLACALAAASWLSIWIDPGVVHAQHGLDQQLRQVISTKGIEPLRRFDPPQPAMLDLGQSLFFDKELSGNRDIACASCHHPSFHTGDGLSLSIGTKGEGLGTSRTMGPDRDFIPRNAPEILNRGVEEWNSMFWDSRVAGNADGQFTTPAGDQLPATVHTLLGAQAMFPVTSNAEMRGSVGDFDVYGRPNELATLDGSDLEGIWSALMTRLLQFDSYRQMFQQAYPGTPWEELNFGHAAEAIGAFEGQAFTYLDSPWDRYLAGDDDALTDAAKRGALLFHGKGNCASCHAGNLFTDQQHHNIGIPQLGPGKEDPVHHLDLGRSRVSGNEEDAFAFRTPSLRNTAITGPWMHNGAYHSLDQAILHYQDRFGALQNYDATQLEEALQGRVKLDDATLAMIQRTLTEKGQATGPLTDQDVYDLLAFLGSLTTTSLLKLEDTVPDQVPSGLPVDRMTPIDGIQLVYDGITGQLSLYGPERTVFDGVQLMLIDQPDGSEAGFSFLTESASWRGQSVFFSTDTPEEQAFHSLPGILGDYVVEDGAALGPLLPAGLTREELEGHIWSRASIAGVPGTARPQLLVVPGPGEPLVGDFNENSVLDAGDIDALSARVQGGQHPAAFDLSGDGRVDGYDRRLWVDAFARTYLGDSNLDGEFNSADLIQVFQLAEYEDGVPSNSSWTTGDWTGDGEFDSTDLIAAFQDGGYERGHRAALANVPEPASYVLAVLGLWGIWHTRRFPPGSRPAKVILRTS